MGGSESKTTVSNLSAVITELVSSTVQSCEVAVQQRQVLRVKNTGFKLWGDYKMEQQTEINASCFNDVNKQTDIQNKIIDSITQASSASNIALLGAFGSSTAEATANLTNIVRNRITMENIQKSYMAIMQDQEGILENEGGVIVFERVELTQGAKVFAAATIKEISKAGIFSSISTYIDQQSSATMTNPLDFISNAIGSVALVIFMVILFILVVAAVFFFGLPSLFST